MPARQVQWDFRYLWTYDLYGPECNAFEAAKSITRASGRGLGTWKSRLFWALCNGFEPFGECHLGPRKVEYRL
jgi:hypothetical protein